MLRYLCLLLILPSLAFSQTTRRALFLGNSYTYVNNLPQTIANLAASTGDSLIFDSNTPGGYTLDQHTVNSTSTGKIMLGGWEYVVLQEQSQLPSFDVYSSSAAQYLCRLAQQYNRCGRVMFYMTWGRKFGDASNCVAWPPVCTYDGMDSLLRLRYLEMGDDYNAEVSPVGAVWHYIRDNYPAIELYDADQSHPSPAGTYAAACTFYAMMFRKDPRTCTYSFSSDTAVNSAIREAAKLVVLDSILNWDHVIVQPQADFDGAIGTGSNEVILNDRSLYADSISWNFGDGNFSAVSDTVYPYAADGTYIVTLQAMNCDLTGNYISEYTDTFSFCPFNVSILPGNLTLCPNRTDTLFTQTYDTYQWYEENNLIPGATQQWFIPSPWKFYSVEVSQNNCTERTPDVFISSYGPSFFYVYNTSTTSPDSICQGDTIIMIASPSHPPYSPDASFYWYLDGQLLPVHNDSISITQSGNYLLRVYHTDCPGYVAFEMDSLQFQFINCTTGISVVAENISVYPNPANDYLNFTTTQEITEKHFSITDLTGRTCLSGQFTERKIDISPLEKGIYYLKAEGFKAIMFVKE